MVADETETGEGPAAAAARLRALDPHVLLAVASTRPTVDAATAALRAGLALYLPWPESDLAPVVLALRDALRRSRLDRLVDNLFVELYREARRAAGGPADAVDEEGARAFRAFRELVGIKGVVRPPSEAPAPPEPVATGVDGMLLDTLEVADPRGGQGTDRRAEGRVREGDVVHFKARHMRARTAAFIGDISPSGLFVRTPDLLAPGTLLDLDVALSVGGARRRLRCRGQVAWVARDDRRAPLGPGFGVKLLDPSPEAREILARAVSERRADA